MSAIAVFHGYEFRNNACGQGPDIYRASASLAFASTCSATTENFGNGHLQCVGCVKDMPQFQLRSDCKVEVSASSANSQSTFEDSIITGTTITLSSGFTVASEIVILEVTGLKVNGGGFTVSGGYALDPFGNPVAASSRIFYVANAAELTISNLILTNGYAKAASYGGQFGGAIYVGSGVRIVLDFCTFTNNLAVTGYGGALNLGRDLAGSTTGITATLTSCTFSGNSATTNGYGAGLFIGAGVIVTITDCAFTNNVGAYYGGGIAQYQESTATLTRVTFTSNAATYLGGAYFMGGPASCVTSLSSCTFTSNTAAYRGGAVSSHDVASSKS